MGWACNVLRKIDPNFIVHYFVHGSKSCGLVVVNAISNRSGEFSDCTGHRRTGYFLPGGWGAANHLPKKILQVAQMFTKQSNRNEGRCNNIGRTGI